MAQSVPMEYTDSTKCCAAAKPSLLLVCGAKVSNHWYKHWAWCWRSGHPKAEGRWSHAKEQQHQPPPPPTPPSAGRLASLPDWPDHLQRVSCLYHTSLCAHWPGFLHHKSHKRKLLIMFSSEDVIIPENAPENLTASSVASASKERSIRNGLSS